MEREKASFPITMMCRLLGVAKAGFYAWRKKGMPPPKPDPEDRPKPRPLSSSKDIAAARPPQQPPGASWTLVRAWIAAWVWYLWHASKRRSGARRIRASLAGDPGIRVSLWLVFALMRELGIEGIQPRASKKTTVADPNAAKRPDLLGRRFYPPVPGTFLVGDITYIRTRQGWMYLATVIDLTCREVIGWQIADHMRASLVCDALDMAVKSGKVAGGAVFHSDRGAQYTSAAFARTAERLDVRLSVSRTGSCLDNAVAESFFSMLKNEMVHHEDFATKAEARVKIAEYIEVDYNRNRLHSTLGYRTPAQARADHFTQPTATLQEAA